MALIPFSSAPAGAQNMFLGSRSRWLTPPANFRGPSGPSSASTTRVDAVHGTVRTTIWRGGSKGKSEGDVEGAEILAFAAVGVEAVIDAERADG